MVNRILLMCIFIMSFSAFAEQGVNDINQVVKIFEQSIKDKNKNKFLMLFINEPVTWVGVYHEKDYQNELEWSKSPEGKALKKKIGDKFRAPAKVRFSSPEVFIDSIIDNTKQPIEKVSNVKVNTDGEVAAISFDYQFFDGDIRVNYGTEHWQLIRTIHGWKISAVNYSISRG